MVIPYTKEPELSHNRFSVIYQISRDEKAARACAKDITLEQTVEFPEDLVPNGMIKDEIIGHVESFEKIKNDRYQVEISFAVESAGNEFVQLLNVIFGNISLKPDIRIEQLNLSEGILAQFKGPRFGVSGVRKRLNIFKRPILCSALKPQGLSAEDLAQLCYQFALGGMDIIKDDHGIANQSFSLYKDRVLLSAKAVERANRETGGNSIYAPNITAPFDEIRSRALYAKECGAGALVLSPGLVGLESLRAIAEDDQIALPLFAHPALLGTYVIHPTSGISHYALFGQLFRLCGADASIFPHFGGRFSFSAADCLNIARGCREPLGTKLIKEIFPAPGGGLDLEKISELIEFYGTDVMFLIGGGLFRDGGLIENCRKLKKLISLPTLPVVKGKSG
jgi:ribulose-bisphosphate carboxylase large chain